MRHATCALFVAALAAVCVPARAEVRTLETRGLWSAFGGTAEDQRQVCGIATAGAEGRRIAVAQFPGDTGLVLTLDKDSWAIPDDTAIDFTVQFDTDAPVTLAGRGSGRRITAGLAFAQSIPFMRALRHGGQMHVNFPGGNEPSWTGGLSGSSAAIDAFNGCRGGFTTTTAPTQPVTAAPVATQQPTAPTQPFTPSAAPAAPAPAAPAPAPDAAAPLPPIPQAPKPATPPSAP